MTQENERPTEAELEPEPEAKPEPEAVAALEPEPEAKPEPEAVAALEPEPELEPVLTTIQIQVPVSVNDELKALAELWGETEDATATKLLTGAIQNQYQINKSRGRI